MMLVTEFGQKMPERGDRNGSTQAESKLESKCGSGDDSVHGDEDCLIEGSRVETSEGMLDG